MSLRTYLFTLIGTLILTLCVSQLFLLYWLEQDIAKDVEVKARHLSEQVIELAFHDLPMGSNNKNQRTLHHENEIPASSIEIIKTDEEHKIVRRFIGKSNEAKAATQHARVDSPKANEKQIQFEENVSQEDKIILKEKLKTMVHQIHDENIKVFAQIESSHKKNEHGNTPENSNIFIETFDLDQNTSALIRKMQILLIASSIVALIFAYWLSVRFNRPLKALNRGFEELSEGKYTHKVPEEGVEEIHKTITQFNSLVKQLEQLKSVEQEHKEIAHLAELGEVSRGLAHSLRNPIHTIGLAIEELNQPSITDATKEKLLLTAQQKIQHIDKNISALLALTNLDFSRNEIVPIRAVIQDVILECKSDHTKEISFTLDVDSDLQLKGSETELRNIFHTLIINACEASVTGGEVVIIAEKLPEKTIKVTITDNGNGLAPEIKKNLFLPHVSSKPEGAGMGLYIAQRITELHYHGEICLSNVMTKDKSIMGCSASVLLTNNS